jgi:tetratricopeptide (TPR) repeat protein
MIHSWEEDAESRCESVVTEALLVAPSSPETLQTLASVRISQLRVEDAKAALSRSMELWQDLPPEDPDVPDFAARISLSRLLIEVEMEQSALTVLERLIEEDDSSVEAWYLGGWCLFLLGEKTPGGSDPATKEESSDTPDRTATLSASRVWLQHSLTLYQSVEYEDERLRDHAQELVQKLNDELGEADDEDDEGSEEGVEWEDDNGDEEENSDEDMVET